jgi:glutaminase
VRSTYRSDAVSSKRVRSPRERLALAEHGAEIIIHELQGELEFASAERLARTVRSNLDGVRWIVLDLRRVGRIDETAMPLLIGLVDELTGRRVTTIFADPNGLAGTGRLLRDGWNTQRVRDTETALEWAEEALLNARDMQTLSPSARVPLGVQELLAEMSREQAARLRALTETRLYAKGDIVFKEGDPADALYFVTRGLVSVDTRTAGGRRRFRLNTVPAGSAFGELALVDGGVRSSRIVAVEPTECQILTVSIFEKLRQRDPSLCDALFRAIARSLSARLRQATQEIQSLEA